MSARFPGLQHPSCRPRPHSDAGATSHLPVWQMRHRLWLLVFVRLRVGLSRADVDRHAALADRDTGVPADLEGCAARVLRALLELLHLALEVLACILPVLFEAAELHIIFGAAGAIRAVADDVVTWLLL